MHLLRDSPILAIGYNLPLQTKEHKHDLSFAGALRLLVVGLGLQKI